jgi:radical SAM superfamily enzyme YgiQ (UPF0313 family)
MKIGFLALSGIRAHDPELLALGLTLPGFVDRSKAIASLPSLGLLYLAAATPEGHDLRYYEAESDGTEPREVYGCDLVAISTFSAQVFEAYAIADRLRQAGVLVAMGGLHVSVLPEEAARHADYVIVGEGDQVWPAVVGAASHRHAAGIFRARDFPPVDVAQLPVPRYDLLGDRPYNRFTVQTSRGCPWRCDFCASTVMLNQRYRKRPVADVIRDIEAILAVRERPFIEFADDNTFVDKRWGKDLCRALAPLGLRWFTETDISVADDPELLDLMRHAGCRQVLIGLESPPPPLTLRPCLVEARESASDRGRRPTATGPLEGIEMRANFKARAGGGCLDALRRIQAHGITVNGCFILGLDGHTPSIFEEVLAFARAVPLYDVQITILTAFPGTPLYERLLSEGRIIAPERWDLCTLFDVNHHPRGMAAGQLKEGIYWLTERLYSDECTYQRRRGVVDGMRRELGRSRPAALLAG